MSPNIDTPKVETRSVTEERINKVLDVFSGTDWTSGFAGFISGSSGIVVRCQESRNLGLIFGFVETTVCLKSVSRVFSSRVYRYHVSFCCDH